MLAVLLALAQLRSAAAPAAIAAARIDGFEEERLSLLEPPPGEATVGHRFVWICLDLVFHNTLHGVLGTEPEVSPPQCPNVIVYTSRRSQDMIEVKTSA